jgi:hypothetical protein
VSDEASEHSTPDPPARSWFSRARSRDAAADGDADSGADDDKRRKLRTLDDTERKFGFGAAILAVAIAVLFIPSLLHDTKQTYTAKVVKGVCPPFYPPPVHGTCTRIVVQHPSDFVLRFILLMVLGLLLLAAVWASKRTLVMFMSFLTGLAAGTLGLLLIFYGGWLVLRSWRVQRYGTTNSKEIRTISTERAAERSAGRREAKKAKGTTQVPPSPGKSPVTPSKRYTPRAKPRRR